MVSVRSAHLTDEMVVQPNPEKPKSFYFLNKYESMNSTQNMHISWINGNANNQPISNPEK